MLLNLLWVVLGGLPMALAWWLAALICAISIVGLPWARSCWVIGCFSLWPFGSEAMNRRQLRGRGDLGTGPLGALGNVCLLYTSPSPRDRQKSRMPSSA